MAAFWSKIVAFFSSIFMALSALFGLGGNTPGPSPEPEPVIPTPEQGVWLLTDIPAYGAGTYSTALYNTGTGLDYEFAPTEDTGEIQEDPDESETDPTEEPAEQYTHKDSFMQIVSGTTQSDFTAYCGKLEQNGYTRTFSNQLENNYYAGYAKEGSSVYLIHDGNQNVTRVIDDCVNTVSLDQFSYSYDGITSTAAETAAPGVYQFSYPYYDSKHNMRELFASNGMLYVIQLPDNRLVVIDGGSSYQASNQNIAEFIRFIRKLTGKTKNDVIDIAMWYGTHSHADHINFFYKTVRKFHTQLNVQRAMFNYQSQTTLPYTKKATKLKKSLKTWYPDLLYVKGRSGYQFTLGDADFQILYTQEECIRPLDASCPFTNANDASAVLKVTLGGKSFLFLGDAYLIVQTNLLKNFTAATLHADVLQAAHHMYNDLTKLYPVVAPTYVMCPQSRLKTEETGLTSYQTLRRVVPEENFFFAGDNIVYGFLPQPYGNMEITQTPVACGAYDNSSL